jgi:hypothetical protein
LIVRRPRARIGLLAAGTLLASSALATGLAGPASAADCTTTPSTVVPGIQILDPGCGFAPIDGSSVHSGILHGSAYRIEVPRNWNGELVMFAHGFAGTGNVVSVGDPQLRAWFVAHHYAWAASSYRQNGYNVGDGVQDTHDLKVNFSRLAHRKAPTTTYMSGLSMGGEITAVGIEHYRGDYDGAMPYCGVLGANKLFDYFTGANTTAAALTGTTIRYPDSAAAGAAYSPEFDQTVLQSELPALGIDTKPGGASFTSHLTDTGRTWADAVQQISGGTRPGFREALTKYWNTFGFAPLTNIPFLFGLYPGLTGGTSGYADGNVVDTTRTTYQLDSDPALSPAEKTLNQQVLRVAATNTPTTDPTKTQLPDVAGTPHIPVLSMHDIDDLFVPFSMEQVYARQVAANGQADLFVSRAIRGTGHCEFTTDELSAGFSALVDWVHHGKKPAGDRVLDPVAVRNGTFGCQFTDPTPGSHIFFGRVPCPSAS